MKLGCIGDDFTGSSDVANTLAKQGMRTVQYTGTPDGAADADVDAGVVALKSRSIDPDEAVRLSLDALAWLREQGCRQFLFKYCSTFDSTPEGNIGPVAEALADALDATRVIVCPAFPANGRTIYQGHLFVGDRLLSESGMQDHPITPMTDPDLRRWLDHQTRGEVGHVPIGTVHEGSEAIAAALREHADAGHRLVVVDALRDADLIAIGTAAADLPLLTGGSGIALGLPANFGITERRDEWEGESGPCIALSGSCSTTTRAQVRRHLRKHPGRTLDVAAVIEGRQTPQGTAEWLLSEDGVPLVHSCGEPEDKDRVQQEYGADRAAAAIEGFYAEVARIAVRGGARRVIIAGGETSGAVVEGLDLDELEIGPEIDPGVPTLRARDDLVLALKSGNFGAEDFFDKAARALEGAR